MTPSQKEEEMTFQELVENWEDLKIHAKREKLSKALSLLSDYALTSDEEDELDEILSSVLSLMTEMEANDGFGTEGMKL